MPAGIYTIADLMASRFANAKAFGLDSIAATLQGDLATHSAVVELMLAELCEITEDARRVYGTSQNSVSTEVDQFGRSPMVAVTVGAECGFPFRKYQTVVGWTREYLEEATVGDLVMTQIDVKKSHLRRIRAQIARAIFDDTNYAFTDSLVDGVSVNVKRFVNADSAPIPDGPAGEAFDGATHQHYTAAAALAEADILAMIANVVEHGHGGKVKLVFNVAQEAAVRAFTSPAGAFIPDGDDRVDALVMALATGTPVTKTPQTMSRVNNRRIGVWSNAEVWVQSWVPSHYYFCWDAADSRKPLVLRHRRNSWQLKLAAEYEVHPLQANAYEWKFGVGAWTRTNGACYFDNGGAWSDASISD